MGFICKQCQTHWHDRSGCRRLATGAPQCAYCAGVEKKPMAAKRFAYSQQWADIDLKLEWSGGRNRPGDRNRLAMGRYDRNRPGDRNRLAMGRYDRNRPGDRNRLVMGR